MTLVQVTPQLGRVTTRDLALLCSTHTGKAHLECLALPGGRQGSA